MKNTQLILLVEVDNMDKQERIKNIEINVETQKSGIIQLVKYILSKQDPTNAEGMGEKFVEKWDKLCKQHESEDKTNLTQFYRRIMEFKPALTSIIDPGELFDTICDTVITSFNVVLNRIRSQVNEDRPRIRTKGAILPGTNNSLTLSYFCTICKQSFPVPPEIQKKTT